MCFAIDPGCRKGESVLELQTAAFKRPVVVRSLRETNASAPSDSLACSRRILTSRNAWMVSSADFVFACRVIVSVGELNNGRSRSLDGVLDQGRRSLESADSAEDKLMFPRAFKSEPIHLAG